LPAELKQKIWNHIIPHFYSTGTDELFFANIISLTCSENISWKYSKFITNYVVFERCEYI